MLARRIAREELAASDPGTLAGAVLLAPVRLDSGTIPKGTRLDRRIGADLIGAARSGALSQPLRLAWPDQDDMHENDAAEQLARAAGGEGVEPRPPRQSRLDLIARWNGVLHIRTKSLARLNGIDCLELFTLFHGQAVQTGQVVASVKVAPHLISASLVRQGLDVAHQGGPLVEVRPYLPLEVAAIVTEALSGAALTRFEAGARMKVEALGSQFGGTTVIASIEPESAEPEIRAVLQHLVWDCGTPVVLVGGVSAGDPLSPFYAALEALGGRILRHGVPAHPGSMIWLAQLAETRLLGLPQCGMFTMATAADLILPRLLTGERLTGKELAELGHGGVLTRDMRFRFPAYARDLEAPEA